VELKRIADAIASGENLLVTGQRRIGKTSCLLRAARLAAEQHGAVSFFADLSLYSTLADVTKSLLKSAVPELSSLGEKAATFIAGATTGLVLKPHVKASASALGGPDMDFEIGLELRSKDSAAQCKTLIEVLDAIDKLAQKKKRPVAIIFDEFTFLNSIGPEQASWQLRGAMQRHRKIVYILAGSVRHMIEQLHGVDGPFYGMFGRLPIDRIDPLLMASWIDAQFTKHGVKAAGVGAECARLAGDRTRDVIQLARRAFDLAAGKKIATEASVEAAMRSLLEDFDDDFWRLWSPLSALHKSILQAVATGHGTELFRQDTIIRYGLGTTASVSQACRALERNRDSALSYRPPVLGRIERGDRVEIVFDNPFFKLWVASATHPQS
jgi:hypothetical protein